MRPKRITILLLFGILPAFGLSQPSDPDRFHEISLGSDRELFIDHYLVDTLINTRIVLHQPRDEGVVLRFDKSWEGVFSGYCTIIRDGEIFRLYYRGVPEAGGDGNNLETTCYAESPDGIKWTKPNLGLYEIEGSCDNNVVLAGEAPFSHNFSPFLDSNPDRKAKEKFKAMAGIEKSGLFGFVSEDGIHWKKSGNKALITDGKFDSQNVAFWSVKEEMYLCYFRTWTKEGYNGYRSISRSTSKDYVHWSDTEAMTFGDTPLEHLYTNQTHPYFRAPHIYIGVAARFMAGRQVLSEEEAMRLKVNPDYFKDCSDAVLLTSRGGSSYDRTFMEAFIRPGIGLQNWVSRSNYPALNIAQTGPEEMSVYLNQDYAQPTAHLHRYSLRLDGFSSIRAGYNGGEMLTKYFTFKGKELHLNYSTSAAGELKVEIQDEKETAIAGFSAEDCPPVIGNEIDRSVRWKTGQNLQNLQGRKIRLRFIMKDCDLYSIKFD